MRVMVEARREYAVSLLSKRDSSVRHCLCRASYVDMVDVFLWVISKRSDGDEMIEVATGNGERVG